MNSSACKFQPTHCYTKKTPGFPGKRHRQNDGTLVWWQDEGSKPSTVSRKQESITVLADCISPQVTKSSVGQKQPLDTHLQYILCPISARKYWTKYSACVSRLCILPHTDCQVLSLMMDDGEACRSVVTIQQPRELHRS